MEPTVRCPRCVVMTSACSDATTSDFDAAGITPPSASGATVLVCRSSSCAPNARSVLL